MAEENIKVKKKINPIIIIVLVILLTAIASAAVFRNQIMDALRDVLGVEQQSEDSGLKKDPNLFLTDEDAEKYISDKIPSMNVNMSQRIRCYKNEDGKIMAKVNVKNNNENQYIFQLIMAETDEVIYTSGLIPAGGGVKEIPLEKELESGTYSVNVIFAYVSEEDNETSLGSTGVNVELIVE